MPEAYAKFYDKVEKGLAKEHTFWGYHLIADFQHTNMAIDDEKIMRAFFKELVTELKMIAVGEPIIKFFPEKVDHNETRALSAIQLITTSTITAHTDNEYGRCVFLDVFSCKPYDPKLVFPLIEKHFQPKVINSKFLLRDPGIIKDAG